MRLGSALARGPTTPPNAAVMLAVPGDTPTARPVLLMVATAGGVDAQVTNEVRFCWLPSPNTPVAAKFVDMVSGTVTDAGVTLMACNGVDSTMTFAVLVSAPAVAVITALPAFWPVAEPFELMATTEASDELHVTRSFTFCLLPSLNVPVAVKPKVVEGARIAVVGVTTIEARVALLTVSCVESAAVALA